MEEELAAAILIFVPVIVGVWKFVGHVLKSSQVSERTWEDVKKEHEAEMLRKLQLMGYCTDYFMHEIDTVLDEDDLNLLNNTYRVGWSAAQCGLYPDNLLRCWNAIRWAEGLEAVK